MLTVLRGHSRPIQSLSWSHDSRYLLSGSRDWKCILWDLKSGGTRQKRVFNFETPVWSAIFHPKDSTKFVVSLFEDHARYVELTSSETKIMSLPSSTIVGKPEYALVTRFSASGEYIIAGTSKGNINVIRTGTEEILHSTRISSSNIKNMVMSSNGRFLVVNSSDRVVRFVSVARAFNEPLKQEKQPTEASSESINQAKETPGEQPKDKPTGQNEQEMPNEPLRSPSDLPNGTPIEMPSGEPTGSPKPTGSPERETSSEQPDEDDANDCQDPWQFEVEHKFQDVVNRLQWNAVSVSPTAEYVLASTYEAAHDIYMWETSMGSLVKIYEGPKEELVDVEWHPSRPVIAATGLDSGKIYMWTSIVPQRWSALAPDFVEVEENIEYQEREDEFDVEDETAQNQRQLDDEDEEVVDVITMDDSTLKEKGWFSIPVSLELEEEESASDNDE